MLTSETPNQALRRLLAELEEHRHGRVDIEHYSKVRGDVDALLRDVPLLHKQNKIEQFRGALEDRRLRPRRELGIEQLPAEAYLGLGDVIYTAAGLLYPDSRFAFVLAPCVEKERKVDASPWDSASFYRSLCPHLPAASDNPKRREAFLAYTLPAPEYREYLVHYIATCFRSGHDYLNSRMHVLKDPLGAISDNERSRIFEVRLAGSVPLDTWSIETIFAPRDTGDDESTKLRNMLSRFDQNGQIAWYNASQKTLQQEVRSWFRMRSARAGGTHAR